MIEYIIEQLEKKGYTQSQIWRETGIPQSCISRYKSGKTKAHATHVPKLVALAENNGIRIKAIDFRKYVMSF